MDDFGGALPWHSRIRELPAAFARSVAIGARIGVRDALAALDVNQLDVLLVTHRGALYALTRDDLERVMPSPATTLARYELPELVRRVAVRQALRAPARVLGPDDALIDAVRALRETGWRPVVVRTRADDRSRAPVEGVITAQSLLAALAAPAVRTVTAVTADGARSAAALTTAR